MNLRRGRGTKSMLSPVSRLFRFFASALTNARRLFSQPVDVLWNIDRFHISSSFFFLSPSIIAWIKLDIARYYSRSDVYVRSWRSIVYQYHATVPFVRACSTTNSLYNWSTCNESSPPILYVPRFFIQIIAVRVRIISVHVRISGSKPQE